MIATLSDNVSLSPERQNGFHARSDAFFCRFPDSSHLKQVRVAPDGDSHEFQRVMKAALGPTLRAEQAFKQFENQLNSGELAVPYCWIPRNALRHVPDIIYLWTMSKESHRDARAYHLVIRSDPNERGEDLSRGLDVLPLLDITTLIVLHEIDLLDIVFQVFPRIAIAKRTLWDIQNLSRHSLFGGYQSLKDISDSLRQRLTQIEQPESANSPSVRGLDPALDEIRQLASTGRYVPYVDDERARSYINIDHRVPCITTLDLIDEAYKRELITVRGASEKIGKLLDCRCGIVVRGQYFFGSLPPTADDPDRGFDEIQELLSQDTVFQSITSGLWDIRLPYEKVLAHSSINLGYLADRGKGSEYLIAAVWFVWLNKVQFRSELELSPKDHLATSFVKASRSLEGEGQAIKQLWNAFILVVEKLQGAEMDESKEMEARYLVGKVAAVVAGDQDASIRDHIFERLASGLTEGTQEYEAFDKGYQVQRARSASKQ